jgi:MoaA/NifB/PqqE/SkfB family radical SAM enzyme
VASRQTVTAIDVSSRLSSADDLPAGNLSSVDIYISSLCNRRCTYCFLSPEFFESGSRMTLDRFAGIVDWSRRRGVGEITLLGGEPSLHPDFADMVRLVSERGLKVRVVTNGARRFQRLLADKVIDPGNLSRVAVSLDSLDETVQDEFRGRGAYRDAMNTIGLLRERGVLFDINITGVRAVLGGLDALIGFADEAGCRRVNIHWPSSMGIGGGLTDDQLPGQGEWLALVRRIESRTERRPDFFVEIERGFLAAGEPLVGCALDDFSNLQIFPDGRAYRCGLLVDQDEMSSLSMIGDQLRFTRRGHGEELLRTSTRNSCESCPVKPAEGRACIYDKASSARRQ